MQPGDVVAFARLMARMHAVFGVGDLSQVAVEEYWQELQDVSLEALERAYGEMRRARTRREMPLPADIREAVRGLPPPAEVTTLTLPEGQPTPPDEALKKLHEIQAIIMGSGRDYGR